MEITLTIPDEIAPALQNGGDRVLSRRALELLALDGVRRLQDVDVAAALMNTLPYELRRRFDAQAPARFETPAGSSLLIDYTAEGGPALDVRLQEMFGQDVHPSVARGRVPLTLRPVLSRAM